MVLEWWHWAVVGVVLILAELALPAFVLLWFGVAAMLVAGLVWLVPGISLIAQVLVLIIASGGLVALWFKVVKPGRHKTRLGMADAGVIGEVGVLIENVAPFKRGRVRFQRPMVGADVWECIAEEDIQSGDRVRVLAVEGSLLSVGRDTPRRG